MSIEDDPAPAYARHLADYLATRGEDALYQASLLSQVCIHHGLGPEEIVALHSEAAEDMSASFSEGAQSRAALDGLQFLLEVMIAYGVQHRHYQDMRSTERDRTAAAEAALAQQRIADAEQAARDKTAFLATVAHELRTPLTVVKGNIQLARRSAAQQRWERLPRSLDSAHEAADRLSRLTEDLVVASRGELRPIALVPIDARVIAERACEWAQLDAERKGVVLSCRLDEDTMPILGDEDALLMVLTNLLSNAVRYTNPGGHVDVRTGQRASDWCIEVFDSGIGMTPDDLSHIFDDFFRAEEARARDGAGLGVGLALANRLARAQGGRLEVESEHGRGSLFRVVLPMLRAGNGQDGA